MFWILGLVWLCCSGLEARPVEPVLVTDQTVRIRGEQRFFYALETGDVLWLEAKSVKGKPLRQVSVWVYGQQEPIWTSSKGEAAVQANIPVDRRAVYEIRIQAGGQKTVQLTLKRQPKYESRTNFDTQVEWKTITDTIRRSYRAETQMVYDTSYPTQYRRVHYRTAQHIHPLADRTERVHSKTHLQQENYNTLSFQLPTLRQDETQEETLLGMAFWIGVGQEGLEQYTKELKKFLGTAAAQVAKKNLLAGLALGAYAVAVNPPQGDNIHYQWTDQTGQVLDQGNVTAAYGRFGLPLKGPLQLTLTNDNLLNGLNVSVKLVAVVETRYYREEGYQVRTITPLKLEETRGKVRLVKRQVPVINNW